MSRFKTTALFALLAASIAAQRPAHAGIIASTQTNPSQTFFAAAGDDLINAAAGRRNAMSNKVIAASNAIAIGDIATALDQLYSLFDKLDGNPDPPDWMFDSPEKDELAADVALLIELLELL